MTAGARDDDVFDEARGGRGRAQRLLRPDQAEVALLLTRQGTTPEALAVLLAVPLEVVQRSLRMLAPDGAPNAGPRPGPTELGRVLTVGPDPTMRRLPRPLGWRAPVFVADDESWPPAPAEGDVWRVLKARVEERWTQVPLREVLLWGERVLVDSERRVFCRVCKQLIPVVALGRDLFAGDPEVVGGGTSSHLLGMPARQSRV